MRLTPDTLTHERAAVFMDYPDTQHGLARAGRQIDALALRDYLAEGRHLVEAFAYLATSPVPRRDNGADLADRLHRHGFLVRSQPGQYTPDGRLSRDFTLDIALDIQEFVARVRPDIVILVTSSGALTPLVQRLRLQGVRVEVAAPPTTVAPALRAMANGFIDLTQIGQPVEHLPVPGLDDDEDEDDDLDPAEEAVAPAPVA